MLEIPVATPTVLPSGETTQGEVSVSVNMDVVELPCQPSNHDVLLGMDLINLLHLTIQGKHYIISY